MPPPTRRRGGLRGLLPQPASALAEHVSFIVLLGSLLLVTLASGGRDQGVMAPAMMATLPALVLTAPWRRLPWWALALPALLPAAALAVSYVTPMQFSYSRDLAVWVYAAVVGVATASYARTRDRRLAVILFVLVLAFYEFWRALVPWFGSGRPSTAMVGTFYQQNMFGGFSAAMGIAATALAAWQKGLLALVPVVVAPVCLVGAVLSTSRASIGLLVLGLAALAVLAATTRDRWYRLSVLGVVAVVAVGLLLLLTSSWVFPNDSESSPFAGTTQRTGRDSLSSSSSIRTTYWTVAVRQFLDSPLVGEGFGSYGTTFYERAPLGAFGSVYAHNGVLQALGEGGLLFGLPVLALTAMALGVCGRAVLRLSHGSHEAAVLAAGLGGAMLLAHAMVDFDWTYPAMAGLFALLVALGAGTPAAASRPPTRRLSVTSVTGLFLASAWVAVLTHDTQDLDELSRSDASFDALVAEAELADSRLRPNPRLWAAALEAVEQPASPDSIRRALSATDGLGRLDPTVELVRARAMVAVGLVDEGLRLAADAVESRSSTRPDLDAPYARLLVDARRRDEAVTLLTRRVRERAQAGYPAPGDVWLLVGVLQSIQGVDALDAACAYQRADSAFGSAERPPALPRPAAPVSC